MSDPRIPSAEQEKQLVEYAAHLSTMKDGPHWINPSYEAVVVSIAWALAERDRADTAEEELKQWREWDDAEDEWSAATDEAFPTRSGSHEAYATAMAMVSHRQSKGNLVELVNWLLVRIAAAGRTLGAVVMAAHPLAHGEERVPTQEDEHSAVQAVLRVVGERDRIAEDRDDTETQRHAAVRRYMRAEERIASLVAQVEAAEARADTAEAECAELRASADALTIENLQLAVKAGMMADIPETELRARTAGRIAEVEDKLVAAETRERKAVARADRLAEASREAGVHPVNQDTCGVCGKHFDECEEDTSHCGDGVMFPSCAGARIRAAIEIETTK